MPKVKRPYSRVYWEVVDDPKFAHVWGDNNALATWLRLLMAADMAWPASAHLYDGVHRASVARLSEVGLVDLSPGGRYRIHGLDKERQERSDAATDAVRSRYARSTPVADKPYAPPTDGLPRQDEQSKDKTSKANTPTTDAFDVMLTVENLTRRPFNYREGHQVHDTLIGDVAAHGADKMSDEYRRFREAASGPVDAAQLVFGVHNALHPLVKAKPMTDAERKDAEIAAAIRELNASARPAA